MLRTGITNKLFLAHFEQPSIGPTLNLVRFRRLQQRGAGVKVLHLSTYDVGGTGHAAYQLHKSLQESGVESCFMVRTSLSGKADVVQYIENDYKFRIVDKLRRSWVDLTEGASDPDYGFYDREITYFSLKRFVAKASFRPDIIVAHGISGFLSMGELAMLQKFWNIPIVWHMMDVAPLTGGCHFSWDCLGYTRGCGNCPALHSHRLEDQSYRNLERKKRIAATLDLAIVAPSQALIEQVRHAAVFRGKRIHKILLSIAPSSLCALDKAGAKRALSLPPHVRNIFFGAHSITDRRKGVNELLEALESLAVNCPVDAGKVLLTTAGNIQGLELPDVFPHKHLGYLPMDELFKAYKAADIFLCSSIEDAGPMMINEAIASGTPVVSFDIGVAPDLVITGITGYRAPEKSGAALAEGLRYVLGLNDGSLEDMAQTCAEHGRRLCFPRSQAEQFISLFNELMVAGKRD